MGGLPPSRLGSVPATVSPGSVNRSDKDQAPLTVDPKNQHVLLHHGPMDTCICIFKKNKKTCHEFEGVEFHFLKLAMTH